MSVVLTYTKSQPRPRTGSIFMSACSTPCSAQACQVLPKRVSSSYGPRITLFFFLDMQNTKLSQVGPIFLIFCFIFICLEFFSIFSRDWHVFKAIKPRDLLVRNEGPRPEWSLGQRTVAVAMSVLLMYTKYQPRPRTGSIFMSACSTPCSAQAWQVLPKRVSSSYGPRITLFFFLDTHNIKLYQVGTIFLIFGFF